MMIVRAIALYYQKDIILACCFVDVAPSHMRKLYRRLQKAMC
jgi:hypothetical protein